MADLPANSPFPLDLRTSASTVFPGLPVAWAALAGLDVVRPYVVRSLASFREPGRDSQSAVGAMEPQDELQAYRVLPPQDGPQVLLPVLLVYVVR